VAHDLTCLAATVLLAPDDGVLDVLVVYRPSALTSTGSPWTSPRPFCRPDSVFTVYTAIRLTLPPDLTWSGLRDVGAGGPAQAVSPHP
jgi:hypothetical protein